MDAYQRLLKLGLKDQQERDIVRVLMHCCQQEKAYNPYYTLVAQQFIQSNYSHVITFQYALWDNLKLFSGKEYQGPQGALKVSHLAKMAADLVYAQVLPISVLKTLVFTQLKPLQECFMQIWLTRMLNHKDHKKFMKPWTKLTTLPDCSNLIQGLALYLIQCSKKALAVKDRDQARDRLKELSRLLVQF